MPGSAWFEPSLDHRAEVHLERPVLDVADDLRLRLQFQEVVGRHRAVDGAVDHHVRDLDLAVDARLLADHQRARLAVGGRHVAAAPGRRCAGRR